MMKTLLSDNLFVWVWHCFWCYEVSITSFCLILFPPWLFQLSKLSRDSELCNYHQHLFIMTVLEHIDFFLLYHFKDFWQMIDGVFIIQGCWWTKTRPLVMFCCESCWVKSDWPTDGRTHPLKESQVAIWIHIVCFNGDRKVVELLLLTVWYQMVINCVDLIVLFCPHT